MSHLSRNALIERLAAVKLFALDVDGVLTDNCVYFGPDGAESKRFHISDGLFISLAMKSGLEIAIVSGRYSAATDSRMRNLGVRHVFQDKRDKREMLSPLLETLGIGLESVAFLGNDLPDLTLLECVGLPLAVADAFPAVKRAAAWVAERRGGDGAVRELLELYFEATAIDPGSLLP
jgi:3-deoxy-D-manno-octulosonate 8-phosphate phosphatase (KDO 8-P phosphatase)